MLVNRRVCHGELCAHTTTSGVISIRCVTEALCSFSDEPRKLFFATLPFPVTLLFVFFFFVFFTLGRGAPLRAELHYVSASDQAGSLYREPVNFAIGIYCDDQLRTMNAHDDSIPH